MQKLKYHVLKTINYEKEEMIPLSEEENKSYEEQDVCYISKKKNYFDKNDENENNENNAKFKKYRKVKIIVITSGNLEKLLIGITI